jgi:RimJ/RimL family protein N-acetyltransferase
MRRTESSETPRQGSFDPIADARPLDTRWPAMRWPPTATRLSGHVVDLIPWEPARDTAPLFDAVRHESVWAHLTFRPGSPSELAELVARWHAEGRFAWVVRLRESLGALAAGAVVGMTSYLEVSVADARLEIGATAYAPAVWGTKVNPDAKLLLLTHAFDALGAGRVQLKTDVRNVRSQRAIAGLGARYEGTLRRYQRRHDGTVRDSVLFSIVAEDWPAVRERLVARVASAGDR